MDIQQYFKKHYQFGKDRYAKQSIEDLKKKLADIEKEYVTFHKRLCSFYMWSEDWLEQQGILDEQQALRHMLFDVDNRDTCVSESIIDDGWPEPTIYSLGDDKIIFVSTNADNTPYPSDIVDAKSFLKLADIHEAIALFYYVHYSGWSPQTTRERFHFGTGEVCLSELGSNMPTHLARYFIMIADIIKAMSEKAPAYL